MVDTIQSQQNQAAVETAKALQSFKRSKSKLNDKKSEIIEDQILRENPDDLESVVGKIAVVKSIPPIERIVFRNARDAGVKLDFHYSSKNIPLTMYHLEDGKEYDLPCEVIDHLMDRKVPQYGYRKDADGKPEMYVKTHKYHFNLQRVRQRT